MNEAIITVTHEKEGDLFKVKREFKNVKRCGVETYWYTRDEVVTLANLICERLSED